MSFITGQFVVLTLPDCVVFDLRDLGYNFGNGLGDVSHAAQAELEGLPCIFVVSDKCRNGLRTLLAPPGAETSDFLFDDLDAALSKAREVAKEYGA